VLRPLTDAYTDIPLPLGLAPRFAEERSPADLRALVVDFIAPSYQPLTPSTTCLWMRARSEQGMVGPLSPIEEGEGVNHAARDLPPLSDPSVALAQGTVWCHPTTRRCGVCGLDPLPHGAPIGS
jgi:hypothetical protein